MPRMCVFYDADGPNGSQFALNPDDVQSVEGDDGNESSEPAHDERVTIIAKDGKKWFACESFEFVIQALEGAQDSRGWGELNQCSSPLTPTRRPPTAS